MPQVAPQIPRARSWPRSSRPRRGVASAQRPASTERGPPRVDSPYSARNTSITPMPVPRHPPHKSRAAGGPAPGAARVGHGRVPAASGARPLVGKMGGQRYGARRPVARSGQGVERQWHVPLWSHLHQTTRGAGRFLIDRLAALIVPKARVRGRKQDENQACPTTLDFLDKNLLAEVSRNGRLPVTELARRNSACPKAPTQPAAAAEAAAHTG